MFGIHGFPCFLIWGNLHSEVEICMQEFYWGLSQEYLLRSEGSRVR